ncbi:hypothetical protein ACFLTX_02760 [Chloroflexota bacterium]
MAKNKFDGVIEAVRYLDNGKIEMVRMYERRWLAFTDVLLVTREDLIKRLQDGQVFVTGKRTAYNGNQFTIGKQIRLSGNGSRFITTKDQAGSRDILTNVPIF